jgi:hypothetical protein
VLNHLRRISNPLTLGQIGLGSSNSKASIWRLHYCRCYDPKLWLRSPPVIACIQQEQCQKAAHMLECSKRNRPCSCRKRAFPRCEIKDFAGIGYSLTAISLRASPRIQLLHPQFALECLFSPTPISSTIRSATCLVTSIPRLSPSQCSSQSTSTLSSHNEISI